MQRDTGLDYVMVLRVAHKPIQALTQLVENGGSLSEGLTYFVHHQPYSPTQSLITDRHKPSNINPTAIQREV
jgi:hypothetical protein